jgi:hypothetical protein
VYAALILRQTFLMHRFECQLLSVAAPQGKGSLGVPKKLPDLVVQ